MNNLFIYTGPHPAHYELAKSLKCKTIKSKQGVPLFGRLLNAIRINKKLSGKHFDLILTESVSRDLLAGAYYKHFFPRTKLVALVTDPKILELKTAQWIDQYLTHWALEKADLLLVGSEMMRELIPAPYRHKTRLFYPGIKDIKKHLNLSASHGKNLVFAGLLNDYKGTDLLNKTILNIRNETPDASLYVAGDGPNVKLFKNRVAKGVFYIGKTENSLFMREVASFYVSRARFEPSGCAVIEAMAQGLVPIVSEGVGYKDIVREVSPKLVVHSDSEIVEIVHSLSQNKKAWENLSLKSKKVAKKYSYNYMVDNFKETLQFFFKNKDI